MNRAFPATVLVSICLVACTPSKKDQCATIQSLARKEMRSTDQLSTTDTTALKTHAELIAAIAAELRGLEIQDEKLRAAAQSYVNSLEGLAKKYAADGVADDEDGDLKVYTTMVNSSRRRIVDVCNRR